MRDLSARYPIWLCDIWGVVHNGVAHFPPAVAALKAHREAGGFVSDSDGGQAMFDNGSIVAGNEAIHKALLKTIKKPVSAR